jgi:S-adenosylmethionine-diacylgycerolhomoserine-N-methlytransferase
MSLAAELKTLMHLTLSPVRGSTHAERLESFYGKQAAGYDAFRDHLLQGRKELMESMPTPTGSVWAEMGGGTGRNLEFLGDRLRRLGKIFVVDLSPSLLEQAKRRAYEQAWHNVETIQADAATFQPPVRPLDAATFSYSLTMIPDWFAAIEQAYENLRPGGVIGVVDFYVGRKHPTANRTRHSWFTRTFWPTWFAFDNVFLGPDHVEMLHRKFQPLAFSEHRARIRYLPGMKVPYYRFVGRKPL